MLYDDGDQEWLSLKAERIDWSQNEGVRAADGEGDQEEEEVRISCLPSACSLQPLVPSLHRLLHSRSRHEMPIHDL